MRMWLVILALTTLSRAAAAEHQPCTQQEAITAETQASTLESWDALHRSFIQFGHCDDASIAEGYSEAVSRLLAEDWKNLPVFQRYAARNRAFERFVLRHVDGTWSLDRVRTVAENARERCSNRRRKLCQKILRELAR